MSPQALAAIASTVLSLLFSYIPGFKTWYQPLSPTFKRLVMLSIVTLAAAGAFGFSCAGWGDQLNISLTCNQTGALGLLQTLITALAANQATFLISPKPAKKVLVSKRDKLNGHPRFESEASTADHETHVEGGSGLPHAVTDRYEKPRMRPNPGDKRNNNQHKPHPVKIRSINHDPHP